MQQLLISILEDLNNTSTDIIASAVISTDGLPMATMLPSHLNSDRVGAISATLLALASRSVNELACGELEQIMIKGKLGYMPKIQVLLHSTLYFIYLNIFKYI